MSEVHLVSNRVESVTIPQHDPANPAASFAGAGLRPVLEQERELLVRVPGSTEVTLLLPQAISLCFHVSALISVLALFSGGLLPHSRKDLWLPVASAPV